MYNSCNYNNVKFNSLCVSQPVVAPPSGGEGRPETLRGRVFRREFFNLVGTKLFLNKEQIGIIGTKLVLKKQFITVISSILLARQANINLISEIFTKDVQDLAVFKGTVLYPTKVEKPMHGFKVCPTTAHIAVEGKFLQLSKQLQLIEGKKLFSIYIQHNELKGLKKILCKQNNMVRGQKDITEILEILDMLEEE